MKSIASVVKTGSRSLEGALPVLDNPAMAAPIDPTTRPDSLSRQIYATLREGIIRGRYPQGSRLAEQRLAEELQVSRVPLREAVPVLEIEGFVSTLPRRSAIVTTWTIRSVHDLFDLRLCLEVGAARYAARRIADGASIAPLRAALETARGSLNSGDAYRIADDSTRFHEGIVDLTDNALMRAVMRSLAGRMMWLFFMTHEPGPLHAHNGHEELLAAIESGDERVAEAVAYTHIEHHRIDSMRALRASSDIRDEPA
ncbi:GntR family transcriptional regulator [Pseudonocardia yunnanensis]|uniref:GntR family transcriptional regulator n=1 Tax=Pseudonocardia yunnanensis TaxID=58107 RepID=A0ABW4F388_9PSEU